MLYAPTLFSLRRSCCPGCKNTLAWYDLIPLFSWLQLKGLCRYCKQPISSLYPFIESLTLVIGLSIATLVPADWWLAYGIFSSALIITIRTDLEAYGVWRWVTLYAVPLGWLLAYTGFLPLSLPESLLGSCSAYIFLYAIRSFFYWYKGFEGLGMGDVELLSFIGAFLGLQGWWAALFIGAAAGSVVGLSFIAFNKDKYRNFPIPFCPFLAAGAWMYMLLNSYYF